MEIGMKNILVTGGAGFVGSHIALRLKQCFPGAAVTAFDNLYRKGSELNIPRLEAGGVRFARGDVRRPEDLAGIGAIDCLVECSAEPSVMAGRGADTGYLIQTNLSGALNCAELCRKHNAAMLFISTSRVYPIKPLLEAKLLETATRFELDEKQITPGLSPRGLAENFPMNGARSLYGATKYAAEIMLEEYRDAFKLPIIINRCGVLAGPWQFGKADQGIAAFWTAAHLFGKPLKYIGFGGSGKQVRDMLHIDDLLSLVELQLREPNRFAKEVFNIGGGREISVSLLELTVLCEHSSGRKISITPEAEQRYADIPVYLSDISKIESLCDWSPKLSCAQIVEDIHRWLKDCPEAQSFFRIQ